jgi:hypothetical protein
MCVAPSQAFNCMVMQQPSGGLRPLYIFCHARNGNYFGPSASSPYWGSGNATEWMLSCDDPVSPTGLNTFWIGYNGGNDWETFRPAPDAGANVQYTRKRIVYTVD